MPLLLNMQVFWLYKGSEYARVTQCSEHSWINPEYVWLCLDMTEYAWMASAIYFPIFIPFLLGGYLFQFSHKTRSHSLKKHKAVFWQRQTGVTGSIWCVFCFRLNIFTIKISNLLLPLRAKGEEGQGLWILIYHWSSKFDQEHSGQRPSKLPPPLKKLIHPYIGLSHLKMKVDQPPTFRSIPPETWKNSKHPLKKVFPWVMFFSLCWFKLYNM